MSGTDHEHHHLSIYLDLMGTYVEVGDVIAAEKEVRLLYRSAESAKLKHVSQVAALGLANLLCQQGRYTEALNYYEEGIALSKQLNHHWDRLYGQIWRALCLACFGDPIAHEMLMELREECNQLEDQYLSSLSTCFLILTRSILDLKLDDSLTLLNNIDKVDTPDLYVQALAAVISQFDGSEKERTSLVQELLECMIQCKGVSGYPEIISQVVSQSNFANVDQHVVEKFQDWKNTYIRLIEHMKEQLDQQFSIEFHSEPKLRRCDKNCEAFCCYDGVYLSDEEEEKIKEVVMANPTHFAHLPEEYIVDGNWRNIVKGRKTATRPYRYQHPDYPNHFEQTRCVFADNQGRCTLQTLATHTDRHPWKFKPKSCWLFPITMQNGRVTAPPTKEEKDPDCIEGDYPGFVKYTYCGKHDEQGKAWYRVLKQELFYADFFNRRYEE